MDVPIVGEVGPVLMEILAQVKDHKKKPNKKALAAWWKLIGKWRKIDCLQYDKKSKLIKPQYVVEKLYEVTKGDAFVTSDVGQHQMFAAQFYKFDKPRRWINSGGGVVWGGASALLTEVTKLLGYLGLRKMPTHMASVFHRNPVSVIPVRQ